MKCLVTNQGTGADETGLCNNCYPKQENRIYARKRSYQSDDIFPGGEFVDCSENDAIKCCICGESDEVDLEEID